MSTNKPVTEADFRMPEFRDAKVEDYERRDDGRIVRKDRWEMGIRAIACTLGMARDGFEIEDVVKIVAQLSTGRQWVRVEEEPPEDNNDVFVMPYYGEAGAGYYSKSDDGMWFDSAGETISTPKYWMEIPPLPKEDEDDSE